MTLRAPEATEAEMDAIAQLEADIDRRMRAKMPDAYAEMLANRRASPPNSFSTAVLCELGSDPPKLKERVVKVAPAPSDTEIEAVLGALAAESFAAATRSFQLAREASLVGLRDVHAHQAARLTRACAEVSTALMRTRGKGERMVIEHRHHHLHQRIP
jgi:hypothetical protein